MKERDSRLVYSMVIEGLQLSVEDSEKLLKQIKAKLGTGGTVKNEALVIQGDHCEAVMAELAGKGYRPKRSGGYGGGL